MTEIKNTRGHAVAQGLRRLVVAEGNICCAVDEEDRLNIDFNVGLSGRSNWLRGGLDQTANLYERLGMQLLHPLDHVHVLSRQDALDGVSLVAKEQEVESLGQLALRLDTRAEVHFCANGQTVELGNGIDLIWVNGEVGTPSRSATVQRCARGRNDVEAAALNVHTRTRRAATTVGSSTTTRAVEVDTTVIHLCQ